jgi:hypothetical protein
VRTSCWCLRLLTNRAIMLSIIVLVDIVFFYTFAWTVFAGVFSVNTGNELGPFVRSGSVFLQGTHVYDINIQRAYHEYVCACIAYRVRTCLANGFALSYKAATSNHKHNL